MAKHTRKDRLARIMRLKEINAPKWVVKSEQVAMLLNRENLHHRGIGKGFSNRQAELYEKFVRPYLDGEEN